MKNTRKMIIIKDLKVIFTFGIVENVLPGMQAAFVDIGEKKNAFIRVQDLCEKVDLVKEEQKVENITHITKPGDKYIIQVKRDSISSKGAKLTTHITLPGRYLVLMPNVEFITVSQKIENIDEKKRLQDLLKKQLDKKNIGAIIRTSAEGKTETEILDDLNDLLKQWKKIQEEAKKIKIPTLMHSAYSISEKILLDVIDKKIDIIWVSDEKIKEKIEKILKKFNLKNNPQVKIEKNCSKKYDIEKQLEHAEKRKIWLKCGGFITIDNTEALIAIDVNSGKYTGKENFEKTVLKVNLEATEEIAKQIRLRDLEGIIIIDYIDMKYDESKEQVISFLENCLKKDRSKTQIMGFTRLNLMEITRKHMYSR